MSTFFQDVFRFLIFFAVLQDLKPIFYNIRRDIVSVRGEVLTVYVIAYVFLFVHFRRVFPYIHPVKAGIEIAGSPKIDVGYSHFLQISTAQSK